MAANATPAANDTSRLSRIGASPWKPSPEHKTIHAAKKAAHAMSLNAIRLRIRARGPSVGRRSLRRKNRVPTAEIAALASALLESGQVRQNAQSITPRYEFVFFYHRLHAGSGTTLNLFLTVAAYHSQLTRNSLLGMCVESILSMLHGRVVSCAGAKQHQQGHITKRRRLGGGCDFIG